MSRNIKKPSEEITVTMVDNFLSSDTVTEAELDDFVDDLMNFLEEEEFPLTGPSDERRLWLSLSGCQRSVKTDDQAESVRRGIEVGLSLAFFLREVLYRLTLSEHFKKALNTKATNLAKRDFGIVNRYKKLLKNFDDLTARKKIKDELTDGNVAKTNKKGDPIPYLTLTQINNILDKAGARKKKQKT